MTVFERTLDLDVSAQTLFDWHAREGAFDRLTPAWENADVETPAVLEDGAEAHIKVRIGPLAVGWTAEHKEVEPGRGFVDEQRGGPFRSWRHEHRFESIDGNGRSRLIDHVDYTLPFGPLGQVGGAYVKARLDRMFRYRHDVTRHDLSRHAELSKEPITVGVTGARGLVGSALLPFLTTGGHTACGLSREPTEDELRGLDVVVHLAGEPLMGRWTDDKKRKIMDSRAEGTRHLAEVLARMAKNGSDGPTVLVSGSAIGVYGDAGDRVCDEGAALGDGFLADVCRAWEDATAPAREAGVRVVNLRIGVVLSAAGGALPLMSLPFKFGAGGVTGSGRQWMSTIAIDDLVDVILRASVDERLSGPVNAVSPEPLTNRDFTKTLANVLGRPSFLPAPAFALKGVLGSEMASEMLLASQRVVPSKLQDVGHTFRYPTVEAALRHVLGK